MDADEVQDSQEVSVSDDDKGDSDTLLNFDDEEEQLAPGYVDPKSDPLKIPVLSSSLQALYSIVECISRGSPSSVYVLKGVEDNKLYAMKMIECMDESEAIKAYHEAMELKKLNSLSVCAYKEFFITYDKPDSSVFVNVVTQYFPQGNLRRLIRCYQSKKAVMPEQMVKKILGEILEGLVYIHDSGFVHRNIKPSNVFQRAGGAMVLGDLGVSTLMADIRTNTRQTFYGTVFMAPEIGQQTHDEKTDLFSIGGVLLNMLTTSMIPEYEFYRKLGEVKESQEVLNAILEPVSEIYSKSMVNIVQTLLRNKHNVRPHILDLTKAGFVQECMAQVDTMQKDKTSRQKETESTKRYSLGENRVDLSMVLAYIADTVNHDIYIAEGFTALADILQDNDKAHMSIDQRARNLISVAMWDNIYNKDVQVTGCYILSNLVVYSEPDDILFTPDVIAIIHKIMVSYEHDPEVQLAAVNLILALSANEKASRYIVQLGCIHQMVVAMRHARYHATLNAVCCMALWSLTVDSENLKVACKENAARDVCVALSIHKISPDVCEAASAALVSLLLDDSCYEVFCELDCPGNLVTAIHLHKKNKNVVKNCCKVLATAVEASEECAYEFLSSSKEDGGSPLGIPTIMEAYKVHKDNSDVVESIVRLLLELSNYENICSEMQQAYVGPLILLEVSKRHKHNREIMEPVIATLDSLGVGFVQPAKRMS